LSKSWLALEEHAEIKRKENMKVDEINSKRKIAVFFYWINKLSNFKSLIE
jgi:hypothetical protein